MPAASRLDRIGIRAATLVLAALFVAPAAAPADAARQAPPPFRSFAGAAAGDNFGFAAATGDVNGDGRADLVIGAPWNDTESTNQGRAYVYLGGPGGDEVPDYVLTIPRSPRALAGYAIAVAGDQNADGWNDIAIGAPASQLDGRVFLYWGGPYLDPIQDRFLAGFRSLEFFGGSLAGVGDMTGDGVDDVWVGAPRFVPVLASTDRVGRGYLFYGGAFADGVVDAIYEARQIAGITDNLRFATSVAPAGDVNHDGFADVLVGQPADGIFTAGRGYIYFGGNPVHRVPDVILLSPEFRYRVGVAVSSAGDFNADGVLDQVIGGPDSGVNDHVAAGRAYVFFGGQTGDAKSSPDLTLAGEDDDDAFGSALAGGVDVTGDGYPDILVGAPQADGPAGPWAGRVYLFEGGPQADDLPDLVLEGAAPYAMLGSSLATGDFDGDGVADAVVGAAGHLGSTGDPGHVHLYDLVPPLPANVFAHDEHRTIPLNEQGSPVCLRLEPAGGTFALADLDPASLRLHASNAADGGVRKIRPTAEKRVVAGDTNGNGVEEMPVCFERADLRWLFSGLHGRREVAAWLDGTLTTGRRIHGDVSLDVVVTGPEEPLEASVSPNPMNPEAALSFALRRSGEVDVRIFDATGRLVRTVATGLSLGAGPQRLRIDGRADDGRPLPSGVYFYRLRTPDGERSGRLVVAK